MSFEHVAKWADFHRSLLSGEKGKVDNAVALLHERDRLLEDYLNNLTYTFPFHVLTPTSGLVSDRFYPPEPVYLVKALASLSTSGSTTSTIDVSRNGAAITPAVSLSMTSGVHKVSQDCRQLFDARADDYVTVTSTTVGTSAKGLVVLLIFRSVP